MAGSRDEAARFHFSVGCAFIPDRDYSPMDTLTFISNVISAMAWPVAVVLLAIIFRGHIGGLANLLRSLKYKEFEMQFGEAIAVVRQQAIGEEVTLMRTLTPADQTLLAKGNYAFVVGIWWQRLAHTISEACAKIPPDGFIPDGTAARVRYLHERGVIGAGLRDILLQMEKIHDSVVNGRIQPFSSEEVAEYMNISRSLRERIEQRLAN